MILEKLLALATSIAFLATVGCSGRRTELTGAVTYNGAAVESGTVSFTPVASGTPFGGKIVSGKYVVEKAFPGQFTALVRADNANAGPLTREQAANQTTASPPNYIPENAAGNSQTVDVTGDAQTLDFALTGPPRK